MRRVVSENQIDWLNFQRVSFDPSSASGSLRAGFRSNEISGGGDLVRSGTQLSPSAAAAAVEVSNADLTKTTTKSTSTTTTTTIAFSSTASTTANVLMAQQVVDNSPNKDNNNEGAFARRFHVAMNLASGRNSADSDKTTCSQSIDLAANINSKQNTAYNSHQSDKDNCTRNEKQQQHQNLYQANAKQQQRQQQQQQPRKRGDLQSSASAQTSKRARREHPLDAASLISRLFFG